MTFEVLEQIAKQLGTHAALIQVLPGIERTPRYRRDFKRIRNLIIEGFSFDESMSIVMMESNKSLTK